VDKGIIKIDLNKIDFEMWARFILGWAPVAGSLNKTLKLEVP
jgi:hypothetical protein